MAIKTSSIKIKTSGTTDVIDISRQADEIVARAGCDEGCVHLFIPGSTAALTTIEYESGVVNDLIQALERLAPRNITYEHDARWGDGNGYAHVRAALVGPSLTIPIQQGRMLMGTWQQIVLCDFDNRPRNREIVVQIQSFDEQ